MVRPSATITEPPEVISLSDDDEDDDNVNAAAMASPEQAQDTHDPEDNSQLFAVHDDEEPEAHDALETKGAQETGNVFM